MSVCFSVVRGYSNKNHTLQYFSVDMKSMKFMVMLFLLQLIANNGTKHTTQFKYRLTLVRETYVIILLISTFVSKNLYFCFLIIIPFIDSCVKTYKYRVVCNIMQEKLSCKIIYYVVCYNTGRVFMDFCVCMQFKSTVNVMYIYFKFYVSLRNFKLTLHLVYVNILEYQKLHLVYQHD